MHTFQRVRGETIIRMHYWVLHASGTLLPADAHPDEEPSVRHLALYKRSV